MIVETSKKLGIQNVHLLSGEDILADVYYDEVADEYTLVKPFLPNVMVDPERGRMNVSLMPYRPYLDMEKPLVISGQFVMFVAAIGGQMKEVYHNYTSNIQVAPANAVLPPVGDVLRPNFKK